MTNAEQPATRTGGAAVEQPILVELYTSQGCHSCPPADVVLSQLGDRGLAAVDGDAEQEIIPLAFHIDYWNYIGWTDPYSSERWSKRQRAYADQLANGRSYTPQLVIHGRAEVVGSRAQRVASAVNAVASQLSEPPSLELTAQRQADGIRVRVTATRPAEGARPALDAWVALYQNDVETSVPRGENAGRKLRNDHIVLDLQKALALPADAPAQSGQVEFSGAASKSQAHALGVVVFLQNPENLQIHGVATLPPENLRTQVAADGA